MARESRNNASAIRTGLEPAVFAILRQPESNALPLGHPTLIL